MKCPLCKRRKFDLRDEEYFEHTGRCFKCDFDIHKKDMMKDYLKGQDKNSMDISKHNHIPYIEEDAMMKTKKQKEPTRHALLIQEGTGCSLDGEFTESEIQKFASNKWFEDESTKPKKKDSTQTVINTLGILTDIGNVVLGATGHF